MAKRFNRSKKNDSSCETFWEGVGEWTGLPLSVTSNSRARLRQIQWTELKPPCTVAFVTASQETRMGRLVEVTSDGIWLASEGSDSLYFWERELIVSFALVLEVVPATVKGKGGRQSLKGLPELGWGTSERRRVRSAAIDRLLRLPASHS